jgi:type I site-specific restriction endonuclease
LPNETSDRIYTHNIDKAKRLYVATLQTISRCYEQFSPAFFDLLVFDEAHRSIFNRLNEVMEYFDARMIGLMATVPGVSRSVSGVPAFIDPRAGRAESSSQMNSARSKPH